MTNSRLWPLCIAAAWLLACGDEPRGLFSESCSTKQDCEDEFDCFNGQCTVPCAAQEDCGDYTGASCPPDQGYCFWLCGTRSTETCKRGTICTSRGLCQPR